MHGQQSIKINKAALDYTLSLYLITAFIGIFLKLLMEVIVAGIFKFPYYNFDRPDTSLTYGACQNCHLAGIRT